MSTPRLVLASSSRYRRELLARLGLPFETLAPQIDETARDGEHARALAERLAREKAQRAAEQTNGGGVIVVGADQCAARGSTLLAKPGAFAAALQQLRSCQGRSVQFYTAATVIDCRSGQSWHAVDTTEVRFRRRDAEQLARYLEKEQPYDCAGGFKAEGLGIALFESIDSLDPTALIGLPLIWLTGVLTELGLDPLL